MIDLPAISEHLARGRVLTFEEARARGWTNSAPELHRAAGLLRAQGRFVNVYADGARLCYCEHATSLFAERP